MITKKVIVGGGTEFPLNGQLVLPDDLTERVPAVVFVHGSGPSNMDEQIYSLTPFKDLAEGLAERGIASIRYDKRTYAYARKVAKLAGVPKSVTDRASEILAELDKADLTRHAKALVETEGQLTFDFIAPKIAKKAKTAPATAAGNGKDRKSVV